MFRHYFAAQFGGCCWVMSTLILCAVLTLQSPLFFLTCAGVWHEQVSLFPIIVMFTMCSAFLAVAAYLQRRLLNAVIREEQLSK